MSKRRKGKLKTGDWVRITNLRGMTAGDFGGREQWGVVGRALHRHEVGVLLSDVTGDGEYFDVTFPSGEVGAISRLHLRRVVRSARAAAGQQLHTARRRADAVIR